MSFGTPVCTLVSTLAWAEVLSRTRLHFRLVPQASRSDMVSPPETRDETFKKQDRILSRQIFRRVYEQGQKFRAQYFTAFVLPNSEKKSRVGITATRKTGNSVKRNRSRRLVREVFRKNKWRVPPSVDIVINVKSRMAEARYDDIEKDFVRFLETNNFPEKK